MFVFFSRRTLFEVNQSSKRDTLAFERAVLISPRVRIVRRSEGKTFSTGRLGAGNSSEAPMLDSQHPEYYAKTQARSQPCGTRSLLHRANRSLCHPIGVRSLGSGSQMNPLRIGCNLDQLERIVSMQIGVVLRPNKKQGGPSVGSLPFCLSEGTRRGSRYPCPR